MIAVVFSFTTVVALRKESVDRNLGQLHRNQDERVALRKESVDRNTGAKSHDPGQVLVALRKESVDRNAADERTHHQLAPSLSARRAWIEIYFLRRCTKWMLTSLSARRAWIEIWCCWYRSWSHGGRSPQGERG